MESILLQSLVVLCQPEGLLRFHKCRLFEIQISHQPVQAPCIPTVYIPLGTPVEPDIPSRGTQRVPDSIGNEMDKTDSHALCAEAKQAYG